MHAPENPTETVSRNLFRAIEQLRRDIRRVELWADALSCFSRPIPDYDGASTHLLTPRREGVFAPRQQR